MEREQIEDGIKNLPQVERDKYLLDETDTWTGEEGNASFTIIRQKSSIEGKEHYSMKLTGDMQDISDLVNDFRQVFGEPEKLWRPRRVENTVVIGWLIDKQDEL